MQLIKLVEGKSVREDVDQVIFDTEADVIVAGLGTAGSIAAITAAEKGLSVIGIERLNGMGGMAVYGCVWDYFYGSSGGRFEKINKECLLKMKNGYTAAEPQCREEDYRCYNGAARGLLLEETAIKAGCDLRYNTTITGVFMDGKKAVGVLCLKGGREYRIKAKILIDSTGDICLCRAAGFEFHSGRESDGRQMRFSKTVIQLRNNLVRGVWTMHGNRENLDCMQLSEKILQCGTLPPCLENQYTENNRMVFEGTLLGLREAPRAICEKNIRFDDILMGRQVLEPLFYAFSPIDNVNRDAAFDSEAQQFWRLVCNMQNYGVSVGISLDALIPKGAENILIAGKGIGVDSALASCVRMRKDMEKCGEAAAVAAVYAIRGNILLRNVPYKKIAKDLRHTSCLNEKDNIGLATVSGCMQREKLRPLQNIDDIKQSLQTGDHGYAILTIIRNDHMEIRRALLEWLNSKDPVLAEKSAFAMGALGMKESFDTLCRIAKSEPEILANQPAYMNKVPGAVYLLGNLHIKEAVPVLEEISKRYDGSTNFKEHEASAEQEMAYLIKMLAENALEKCINL